MKHESVAWRHKEGHVEGRALACGARLVRRVREARRTLQIPLWVRATAGCSSRASELSNLSNLEGEIATLEDKLARKRGGGGRCGCK